MKSKSGKRNHKGSSSVQQEEGTTRSAEEAGERIPAQVQKSFAPQAEGAYGTLYLVATPIGNLEDMTFRAIRTLKEVDIIAAEDTRQTRKLLTHYEIAGRLVSYHEHNKAASGPELVRLMEEGSNIALVSDAGIPAISDPGADLVAEAASRGIRVVPIPGANAALSALIISGLPTDRFLFAGFPPRERKGLDAFLARLDQETATLLLYESPHRLKKTLSGIGERWGERKVAIVRELTKRHEEVVRGTISACLLHLEANPPLGECCLIIEGANKDPALRALPGAPDGLPQEWWTALTVGQHVAHYEQAAAEGTDHKEAMRFAARDRGLSRRDIYQALLEEEKSPSR